MRKLLAATVAIASCLLLADLSFAAAPSTASTQPIGKKLPKFRESGHLDQLMELRVAVAETELDDDLRKNVNELIDQTQQKILALVSQEESSPTDKNARAGAMQALIARFQPALREIGLERTAAAERLTKKHNVLSQEIRLVNDGEAAVFQLADKLDLSDEQREKMKVAIKPLKKENAEWLPPMERATADWLDRRKRLLDVFTDEQKQKWTQLVQEQLDEQRRQSAPLPPANVGPPKP